MADVPTARQQLNERHGGSMERVFVVDDDENICRAVERVLRQDGYDVDWATESAGLFRSAAEWQPRLVILDVRLGREDGREVARHFRALYDTPILMLTGQVGIDDLITGFDSGADDYLGKPFDNRVLLVRVRALIRRSALARSTKSHAGLPLVLDRDRRVVSSSSGAGEALTEIQANLLALLIERVGEVVTRDEIYTSVFRRPWAPSDRSLEVHMSNLRKLIAKIEPERVAIQPVRHVGYRLLADTGDSGEPPNVT